MYNTATNGLIICV